MSRLRHVNGPHSFQNYKECALVLDEVEVRSSAAFGYTDLSVRPGNSGSGQHTHCPLTEDLSPPAEDEPQALLSHWETFNWSIGRVEMPNPKAAISRAKIIGQLDGAIGATVDGVNSRYEYFAGLPVVFRARDRH